MPLRATINNENVLAPFLSQEEWQSLKTQIKTEQLEVRLPCCGSLAYLRTSKQGINHFVHKERDTCTTAPETWQHLKAKSEIVLACKAAGYDALTEVEGDGWRADVLAIKGNVKITFEVQWSTQTWEVTQERQQRYKKAGIRGCWFFKRPPSQNSADRDVPLFKIEVTDEQIVIVFEAFGYGILHSSSERRIDLRVFVMALLQGRIKFCQQLRTTLQQKVRMVFVKTDCYSCGKPFHLYYMDDLLTGCGSYLPANYFDLALVNLANRLKSNPRYQHLIFAKIERRYSRPMNERYMAFCCPHCEAMIGDTFLKHSIIPNAKYDEDQSPAVIETEISLNNSVVEQDEHWCFPANGQFCC